MRHRVDLRAAHDHRIHERVLGDRLAHHAHRHRPTTDHVAQLIVLGVTAPVGVQRTHEHHISPVHLPRPASGHHAQERVCGVRLAGFGRAVSARGPTEPIRLGIEPVHERQSDLRREPEPTRDHPQLVDPMGNIAGLPLLPMQRLPILRHQHQPPDLVA